jgi:hypothetical protein
MGVGGRGKFDERVSEVEKENEKDITLQNSSYPN